MHTEHLYELDAVFTELVETLDGLIVLLKEEREAIIDYDLPRITDVCKRKHEQVTRVCLLDATRQGVIKKLGEAMGYRGQPSLDFILKRVSDIKMSERLRNRLSCVKSLAQAAGEFNQGQRELISHSLTNIQSQISLLDKLQGKGHNTSYNSSGGISQRQDASSVMSRTV